MPKTSAAVVPLMVSSPPSPGRSRNMSAIRSRGNATTEHRIAALLRQNGIRGWRRHTLLPGTPDFAWTKLKVALFIDGCFWHGCPRCYQAPRHNAGFWKAKVEGNRRRDRRVARELRQMGWTVLRVWECRVDTAGTLKRIQRALAK